MANYSQMRPFDPLAEKKKKMRPFDQSTSVWDSKSCKDDSYQAHILWDRTPAREYVITTELETIQAASRDTSWF